MTTVRSYILMAIITFIITMLTLPSGLYADDVTDSTATVTTGISTATATSSTSLVLSNGFDVGSLFTDARVGGGIPTSGGDLFTVIYRPFLYYWAESGRELLNIGPGAAVMDSGTKFSVFGGARLDNYIKQLVGISNWSQTHITSDSPTTIQVSFGPLWTEGRKINNPLWVISAFIGFPNKTKGD